MSRTTRFWLGVVFFLGGGALLAFGGERVGTTLGTALGVAGIGLAAWACFGGPGGVGREDSNER